MGYRPTCGDRASGSPGGEKRFGCLAEVRKARWQHCRGETVLCRSEHNDGRSYRVQCERVTHIVWVNTAIGRRRTVQVFLSLRVPHRPLADPPWMKPTFTVMAGLVPAIGRGPLPLRMAGTSPAMTVKVVRIANRVSCKERGDAEISIAVRYAMEIASLCSQ